MRGIGWFSLPKLSFHHYRILADAAASFGEFSRHLFDLEQHYTRLLGIIAAKQTISDGKALHSRILKTIPRSDLFLLNSLVNMYSKCGFMQDARRVLDGIPQPDVVSWNTVVNGYFLSGSPSNALACFREMFSCGIAPDQFSFSGVLKGCHSFRDCGRALQVHCVIIKLGLDDIAFVANGLVEFYAKFHFFDDSMKVFENVKCKDVVLINTVIGVLAKCGNYKEAFVNFQRILLFSSTLPTRATFINFLGVIHLYEKNFRVGAQVHGLIYKFGLVGDDIVENSLVMMYANCGYIDDALDLLVYSGSDNVMCWTTLISGYANLGQFQDAIDVFCWVYHEAIEMDHIFLVCVLGVLAASECLQLGTQFHSTILKTGFEMDSCVVDALMDMYAKCRSMGDAMKVFQQIGNKCDLISLTTVISGHVHNGLSIEALRIFHKMHKEGVSPDSVACISVLMGCIDLQAINQGEQIHAFVIKSGCEVEISVQTTLISLYSGCAYLDSAVWLFRKMVRHDVISWTALISGFARFGHSEEALVCLVKMLQEGFNPNQVTLASALTASAKLPATETGRSLHTLILKTGLDRDNFICSALIDMYSKCGNIQNAVRCFMETSKDDVVLWNSLLTGHAQHGNGVELLNAFEEMHNHRVRPDGVTFLAVLSGCGHCGLMDEILGYYFLMWDVYGINPEMEHYACVVDALGRAGMFNEAVDFIREMGFAPGSAVLRALLSSCIVHGCIKLGLALVAKMVVLGEKDTANYVLLSNLYAFDRRWDYVRKARDVMVRNCSREKKVGKSWIECVSCM